MIHDCGEKEYVTAIEIAVASMKAKLCTQRPFCQSFGGIRNALQLIRTQGCSCVMQNPLAILFRPNRQTNHSNLNGLPLGNRRIGFQFWAQQI